MLKIKTKGINFKNGFTVLESIVAIAIISLTISGIFASISTSITVSAAAKDNAQAFFLAQEALEVLRNLKDRNRLSAVTGVGSHWLAGIAQNSGDPCYNDKICVVGAFGLSVQGCPGNWGSCPYLRQDTQGGSPTYIYGYDPSWPVTKFRREVQVDKDPSTEQAIVTIWITWNQGSVARQFRVQSLLSNWE